MVRRLAAAATSLHENFTQHSMLDVRCSFVNNCETLSAGASLRVTRILDPLNPSYGIIEESSYGKDLGYCDMLLAV